MLVRSIISFVLYCIMKTVVNLGRCVEKNAGMLLCCGQVMQQQQLWVGGGGAIEYMTRECAKGTTVMRK